ncbi:induced myeloid leukemia cell differentiation protein Mcl-1b [Archocentrus centrarchus]|uniref:induced myeloid leukemia cell differentiation protein Mcl-1b n=1 Tax=Archocentrus centrarchus TaxID=63155 RepID=UPI0011E9E521|nr:induced myeloid leukemia cell differentiation protein Mcl-1 homolog [Archocentrus centrarchus]
MNTCTMRNCRMSSYKNVMDLFLPQNGVVDGTMHYGSGNSSPQDATGTPKDSNGTPKRPNNLGVVSTNGYAPKNITDDVEDGSLPSTPEFHSDSESDEALERETKSLITSFFRDFTGLSQRRWKESEALKTMKRVVADVLEKHRYAYNGMVNKLSLDERGEDVTFVSAVAKSLFADKTTNWGRIASLMAFGAVVCQRLKEKGRDNCVELVSQEISTYLLSDQRDWLVKNNAWDGFVEFFRVADPESTVRNTLMAFAGFAGIGATLALLIR